MNLYLTMLALLIIVLPALLLFELITKELFFRLFLMSILAVYFEALFYGTHISFVFVALYLFISFILSFFKAKSESFQNIIVIGYDSINGVIKVSDFHQTKEMYCGFNTDFHSGDILRINADFWKNI